MRGVHSGCFRCCVRREIARRTPSLDEGVEEAAEREEGKWQQPAQKDREEPLVIHGGDKRLQMGQQIGL